jgi:stage IV sporulation protein FB
MFLNEPANTQADLKFRLLGIPVRVSPLFWVVAFFLHMGGREGVRPIDMLAWVAAVFVSVVVHEMGHALTARHFGHRPWITLHGMGGLASYNGSNDSVGTRLKILAAGPGAGFLCAALEIGIFLAFGGHLVFIWYIVPLASIPFQVPEFVGLFLFYLLYVNVVWGLFNLLPVYPLDGGQMTRVVWVKCNPWEGIRKSLILSIMVCIFMAISSLMEKNMFMVLMFGMMGYNNYQEYLAQSHDSGYGNRW